VTTPPAPKLARSLALEQGYSTNAAGLGGWPYDPAEHTPELIWPLSVQVYDRMRRGDAQIAGVLRSIFLPLRRAPWRIDPNGASDEVVRHVAADLNLPIIGDDHTVQLSRISRRFSWNQHLRMALLHLAYGHMSFETVYRIDAGMAYIDRLSPRMPSTIGRIDVDRSGRLVGIGQYPTMVPGVNGGQPTNVDDSGMVPIKADRLVWYANDVEGAAWQGTSLLRSAYGLWLLKQRALRVNAIKDERNGLGIPIYEGAVGEQNLAAGQTIANQLRAGEDVGAAVPNGARLTMAGVSGSLPRILDSIAYYDEGIARSVLAQFLQLGMTKTGSRALGDSFIDFFKLSLDAVADQVGDDATAQIIEPLVDLNWGPGEQAPKLASAEVDIETDLPPDSLIALAEANIVQIDDDLENYTRERFNLPPRGAGPVRPATPPGKAFVLPQQPITASRGREVRAARKPHPKDDALDEADRARTRLEARHRRKLKAAWGGLVRSVDTSGIVTVLLGGSVFAAAGTDAAVAATASAQARGALQAAWTGPDGRNLYSAVTDALTAGYGQGSAQAAFFQGKGWDSPASDRALLRPFDAAQAADGWWDDTLGAVSRRFGERLGQELAQVDTTFDTTDLLGVALDELGDDVDAATYLDNALAYALSEGSMDRYAADGVQQVEFLTAEDTLVDDECLMAAADGPYPLVTAPVPPLHFNCRCAIASV